MHFQSGSGEANIRSRIVILVRSLASRSGSQSTPYPRSAVNLWLGSQAHGICETSPGQDNYVPHHHFVYLAYTHMLNSGSPSIHSKLANRIHFSEMVSKFLVDRQHHSIRATCTFSSILSQHFLHYLMILLLGV